MRSLEGGGRGLFTERPPPTRLALFGGIIGTSDCFWFAGEVGEDAEEPIEGLGAAEAKCTGFFGTDGGGTLDIVDATEGFRSAVAVERGAGGVGVSGLILRSRASLFGLGFVRMFTLGFGFGSDAQVLLFSPADLGLGGGNTWFPRRGNVFGSKGGGSFRPTV